MLLIIVLIGIIWSVITLFSTVFTPDNNADTSEVIEATNYTEKINNFFLQTFDSEQQLAHLVEADNYFNFKQAPALLINPVIVIYNKKGEQAYTINAKRANYLDNGEIEFKDKVNIKSNTGTVYKMYTKALTVNTKTSDLFSNEAVTYLDEMVTVRAQGVDMNTNKAVIKLLNAVEILQKSGAKINTKNLIIDQSNNKETYHTKEKVHYQSKSLDIYSSGMLFDAKSQKIKLTDGVTGHYE